VRRCREYRQLTLTPNFSHLQKQTRTRMLAVNVSIPSLTVARLQQFRTPQLRIHRKRPTDAALNTSHPLYEMPMLLSPVKIQVQLMQSQDWFPWQRPWDPRFRLCLYWIDCRRKPTRRIKQRVASCHTAEVIPHWKPKSGCHDNLAGYWKYLHSVDRPLKPPP